MAVATALSTFFIKSAWMLLISVPFSFSSITHGALDEFDTSVFCLLKVVVA